MREITAELGISMPDYLTNRDVYAAFDLCGALLEEAHLEVHDMALYGLEYAEQESEGK